MRALYEWTAFSGTSDLTNHTTVTGTMVPLFTSTGITDVILALGPTDYDNHTTDIQFFLSTMAANSINVWALDGYRGYFTDAFGPQGLYDSVQRVVSWNSVNPPNQRFAGFWTDMEPQDGQGQGLSCFHNNKYDSQLSNTSGGVWKQSQMQDRIALMQDWMEIQSRTRKIANDNGLRFGAAMVNWTEDYFGEPVVFPWRGVTRSATAHMMSFMVNTDVYAIMSYSTVVATIESKIAAQLAYAQSLPAASRPIVTVGVETNPANGGSSVSFGSDSPNNTHAAVLAAIAQVISDYPALGGSTINDYTGWSGLS